MLDRESSIFRNPEAMDEIGWNVIAAHIFAPIIVWPNGAIHEPKVIRKMARDLSQAIRQLSLFELSHFEIDDVLRYLDFYRTNLEVVKAGPGRRNVVDKARDSFSRPTYLAFAELAQETIEELTQDLLKMRSSSKEAFLMHEKELDTEINAELPRTKTKIDLNSGLGKLLDRLDSFSMTSGRRSGLGTGPNTPQNLSRGPIQENPAPQPDRDLVY